MPEPDQLKCNGRTQAQDQEQGYRLRVRMAPDGGVYKIAKLDQVSK